MRQVPHYGRQIGNNEPIESVNEDSLCADEISRGCSEVVVVENAKVVGAFRLNVLPKTVSRNRQTCCRNQNRSCSHYASLLH